MKRNQLLSIIFCGLSVVAFSQDPNYSQFYNNPIYYNPSMTGLNNGMSFRLNARNLWGPIPGRFNTISAAWDAQTVYKMGLGAFVYSDVGGEALLRTNGGYLTYSYRPIDTKNFVLQAGVAAGFINKSIDWSNLTFSDQLDETMGEVRPSAFAQPNYNTVQYADFSSGFVMRFNGSPRISRSSFKRFMVTLGGSVHHLSQPNDAFLADAEQLPFKFVGHLHTSFLFNELILQPGAIFEQQNEFKTFSVGINLINRPFTFGIWLRNRTAAFSAKQYDSFIATMGLNLPDKRLFSWRVMYSFDFTVSRLKTSSYGSHEIALIFDLEDKILFKGRQSSKNARRRFQCPKDFSGYQ